MRSSRRSASQSKDKEITESQQVSVSFPAHTPLKSPLPLVVTDPFLTSGIDAKQETNENGTGDENMASWRAKKVKQQYNSEGDDDENETDSKDVPETEGKPEGKSSKSKENDGDEANELDDKKQDEEIKNANDEGKRGSGRPSKNSPFRRKLTKSDVQSSPVPTRAPAKEYRQGTRSSARQQQISEDAKGEKIKEAAREKERQGAEKRKNEVFDEDDEKFGVQAKPAMKISSEEPKKRKTAKPENSAKKAKK
ncbi:hypothetical protein EYC80_001433 [Monilinia laxa]|uniref:Uncharacterized protein n=1 Tax=Monilinia laxa TaxID=61186 RepID=A0A5N6K4T6_MONLA|nr:hypothetical protein EYC80_001433 [Monilinia laxa]